MLVLVGGGEVRLSLLVVTFAFSLAFAFAGIALRSVFWVTAVAVFEEWASGFRVGTHFVFVDSLLVWTVFELAFLVLAFAVAHPVGASDELAGSAAFGLLEWNAVEFAV